MRADIDSNATNLTFSKVNFEKLALTRGFKSANSASVMYYNARKKIITALETTDNKGGSTLQGPSSKIQSAKPRSSGKISTAAQNRIVKRSVPQTTTKKTTHNTGADQGCQVPIAAGAIVETEGASHV